MSVFTDIPKEDRIYDGGLFFMIWDKYPVNPCHILIISHREVETFFDLDWEERTELTFEIEEAKKIIDKKFKPDGYNIGMNCGESAGQTVPHFHCHVIPRYDGDMNDPRGGVRHCRKGKGYYEPK